MEHVLPEVRPYVRNMPETAYEIQTGGSARSREIPTESNQVHVTGVPGHTHNSSAVVSIEADYTVTRSTTVEVSASFGEALNDHALIVAAGYTDSPALPDEDERFRRAIERGVGQMTLLPENCQHIVQEPTKSISEIRTIVTGKHMLDTLTYVQEMGGWVDVVDGKPMATQSFNDIDISVFGYVEPFASSDYVCARRRPVHMISWISKSGWMLRNLCQSEAPSA